MLQSLIVKTTQMWLTHGYQLQTWTTMTTHIHKFKPGFNLGKSIDECKKDWEESSITMK
jgi:hypothetical protein